MVHILNGELGGPVWTWNDPERVRDHKSKGRVLWESACLKNKASGIGHVLIKAGFLFLKRVASLLPCGMSARAGSSCTLSAEAMLPWPWGFAECISVCNLYF